MIQPEVPPARSASHPRTLLFVLILIGGCSPDGEGTISSTPPPGAGVPDPAESASPKASPRIPRGPDQVKALQERAQKK